VSGDGGGLASNETGTSVGRTIEERVHVRLIKDKKKCKRVTERQLPRGTDESQAEIIL
jgi:hypothetical protein